MLTISKMFTLEAAHFLPNHEGKCKHLHGHAYKIEITLIGKKQDRGPAQGMILDFGKLKQLVNMFIIDELDHKLLNGIPGLENPTAENMVEWIFDVLMSKSELMRTHLFRVKVWETEGACAIFEREG